TVGLVSAVFENGGQVQDGRKTVAMPRHVLDRPDAKPRVIRQGEVRFENVGFHYGKGSGVIENVNLVVRPGEKIGLVGPSGAGKSTLVNL
ncbi:ABC transporter ATP-binding protein, partial [Mycobacterium tuberculosis]|nr:ABC transporter ATP-binding protein [Mycobacterium tuberculosis]